MVKLGIGLIVLCILAGAGFFLLNPSHPPELAQLDTIDYQEQPFGTKPVVYVTADIKEGAVFTKDVVELRFDEMTTVPRSIARSTKVVIGKRCKFGLASGMRVSLYDLVPKPKELIELSDPDRFSK